MVLLPNRNKKLDLFAPPNLFDLEERREVRTKSCKKHFWARGGSKWRHFPLSNLSITAVIPDLKNLDLTNYKVCTNCGLVMTNEKR